MCTCVRYFSVSETLNSDRQSVSQTGGIGKTRVWAAWTETPMVSWGAHGIPAGSEEECWKPEHVAQTCDLSQ